MNGCVVDGIRRFLNGIAQRAIGDLSNSREMTEKRLRGGEVRQLQFRDFQRAMQKAARAGGID